MWGRQTSSTIPSTTKHPITHLLNTCFVYLVCARRHSVFSKDTTCCPVNTLYTAALAANVPQPPETPTAPLGKFTLDHEVARRNRRRL